MRLKNEIFAHVLDWLIQNNKVEDQKDLALKTGISQNTISRIMTGKVEPSDDTLRKLNATFGNIFNMQYLRGESTAMLIEDVAYYKTYNKSNIDQSSLVNAALAAKDETIRAKEETISSLRETIDSLKRENAILRQQLSNYQADEVIERHPFPMGVSEPTDKDRTRV